MRRRVKAYMLWLLRARYWRYPKVAELMAHRGTRYNEQVAYVERLRKSGQAFVIRPKAPSGVGRVEKDGKKLRALYRQGYRDAAGCYLELLAFLEK